MTGSDKSDSSVHFQKETFAENMRAVNPPQLHAPSGLDVDASYCRDFQSLEQQDIVFKTLMSHSARNTLASQDPCSIPDDLRDELMRQKRKDDAFKTALCDSFRRNQTCSYGEQCRFAHGVHELRLPQHPRGRNHPKYKTVLCDKFSTTGTCKYGTRCQFIHKLLNGHVLTQASGLNNTSSGTLNQSLFMPSVSADLSMDLNQSLPIRRSDIARAFARANHLDPANESVDRMARIFEQQMSHGLISSERRH